MSSKFYFIKILLKRLETKCIQIPRKVIILKNTHGEKSRKIANFQKSGWLLSVFDGKTTFLRYPPEFKILTQSPMSIPTPFYSNLTPDDFKRVYEPAEDTFLLMDALEKDINNIKDQK